MTVNPMMQTGHGPLFAGRKAKKPETIIVNAFKSHNFDLDKAQAKKISGPINEAVELIRKNPGGNSQVHMKAIEIAGDLGLNPMIVKDRLMETLKEIAAKLPVPGQKPERPVIKEWDEYYNKTVNLTSDANFTKLVTGKGFSPVKISWEDIGRWENSCWGSRISDVGIWVRKDESDPQSAQLALSVRRDNNFRDKVLVVPSSNIKVHTKNAKGETQELSLPDRLKELGLLSEKNDKNVIVSNQFAVVPVPSKDMKGAWKEGEPPRAAFTFSVFPYGSKNMVITDVIEGSSNAVVGEGGHQLLFSNVDGGKAPFTASRAEDRQDLVKLEKELKAKGMDVDVQRYYLIQVPLKKDAKVTTADMGTPPNNRGWGSPWGGGGNLECLSFAACAGGFESVSKGAPRSLAGGLDKVAIGHGEVEGDYSEGTGYQNQRAEEPVRVTCVYFVTPKGEVNETDMKNFTKAFEKWDNQAIWGGSFVTNEEKGKQPVPTPTPLPPIKPFPIKPYGNKNDDILE